MKQNTKTILFTGILLVANILFYDRIKCELWISIRSALLTGFAIAFALAIPQIDFSKIWKFFKKHNK